MIQISLGYQGATDCCLVISDGTITKEFCVESESWKVVSVALENLKCLLHNDTRADEFNPQGYSNTPEA